MKTLKKLIKWFLGLFKSTRSQPTVQPVTDIIEKEIGSISMKNQKHLLKYSGRRRYTPAPRVQSN